MIGPPIVNVAEALQKHSWQMITRQISRIIKAMKAYKYNPPSPERAGGVVYFVLAPQAAARKIIAPATSQSYTQPRLALNGHESINLEEVLDHPLMSDGLATDRVLGSISATQKLTVKPGESQDVRGAKRTEPRKINTALSRGDQAIRNGNHEYEHRNIALQSA